MPHHLRQQVHHNINQDTGTDNIERESESAVDPAIRAQLQDPGDEYGDHKAGKEGRKPPRGLPQELDSAA